MYIDRIHIFTPIFSYKIYIYINIFFCYNTTILEKWLLFSAAPAIAKKGGCTLAVTKANQRAVNKYVKNNYDRINVTMAKGKKDTLKAHAESRGESVNAFINRAIDETLSRDQEKK